MSNLMKLIGTVLALGGLVLGVLTFVKPGVMDVYGIKLDTAAFLFVGGILALGFGAVIDAIRGGGLVAAGPRNVTETVMGSSNKAASDSGADAETSSSVSSFRRKDVEATVATGAASLAATALASKSAKADPVADTITALEQAKADVIKSMGGMETLAPPPPEPAHLAAHHDVAEIETDGEEAEGGDLYVIEEKVVRGRPARILSDDTVEAETDEGWMRFENLEHLNEYLDSVEEQNA